MTTNQKKGKDIGLKNDKNLGLNNSPPRLLCLIFDHFDPHDLRFFASYPPSLGVVEVED
ncbi:hypothetical protein SESBI_12395 [Sesbania bispinosa]|nr:hypothetical protein SESBI_12395 [Sesbania bispinosa]